MANNLLLTVPITFQLSEEIPLMYKRVQENLETREIVVLVFFRNQPELRRRREHWRS